MNAPDGLSYIYMVKYDKNGDAVSYAQFGAESIGVGGDSFAIPSIAIGTKNGKPTLYTKEDGDFEVFWRYDEEKASYILCGVPV